MVQTPRYDERSAVVSRAPRRAAATDQALFEQHRAVGVARARRGGLRVDDQRADAVVRTSRSRARSRRRPAVRGLRSPRRRISNCGLVSSPGRSRALLLAAGELLARRATTVRPGAGRSQAHAPASSPRRRWAGAGRHHEVFSRTGQVRKDAAALGHVADAEPTMRSGGWLSRRGRSRRPARRRAHIPISRSDQGRLAHAVAAEQPERRAGRQLEPTPRRMWLSP